MAPPLTNSPFPNTNLGNLLALLELARDGADPVDHPTPWRWTSWRNKLGSVYAPWQQDATFENSGIVEHARGYSRAFVVAYHASGETLEERLQFATDLTEGDLFKGREWLTWWWKEQWYGYVNSVDDSINDVLMAATVLTKPRAASNIVPVMDLDIHILSNPGDAVLALGRGLFGNDAFSSGNMPRPTVLRWLQHALHFARLDWIQIHDDRYRRIDRIRRVVYAACQDVASARCSGVDVSAYIAKLGYIIEMMDFTRGQDRIKQVVHYQKILYAIEDAMGALGGPVLPTTSVLPPNMLRVLARLPSEAYRRKIKAEVKQCLLTLDIRANHAPTYALDIYDILCAKDTGFLAGQFVGGDGINEEYLKNNLDVMDEDWGAGMEFVTSTLPRDW